MSDRAVSAIADALSYPLPYEAHHFDRAERILAALKAARIALVELSEPEYGPDGEGQFGWKTSTTTITATPDFDGTGWSIWDEDFDMDPDHAYENAAALLAAYQVATAEHDAAAVGARITVEEQP